MTTTTANRAALSRSVFGKITRRIMPIVFLMYLVNYMDRTALGLAGPNGLNDDLQMTATMFGLASGIFFLGYILLEVPSNMIMEKVGAKVWLSRICVSWGIVAALTAFMPNYWSLLVARFLLGVAEAGFAPAVFLYLTYWFPNSLSAKAFSLFLLGIPASSILVSPFASWLIDLANTSLGLTGWRFMLFVTGVPAVAVGVIAYFVLTDHPTKAKWLTDEEKRVVMEDIDAEVDPTSKKHTSSMAGLKSARVWALGIAYMGIVYGLYAVGFFAPSIITGFAERFNTTFTTTQNGFILAVPYVCAAIGMLLWSRHSGKTGDAGWHVLISTSVGASGILLAAFSDNPWLVMVGVTLCATGVISSMPVTFTLPARFLTGASAATGLALVNTLGNIGGFAGPFFTGWLRDLGGGDQVPFAVVAGLLVLSGIVTVVVQHRARRTTTAARGG